MTPTLALFFSALLALSPAPGLFAGSAKPGAGREGRQEAGPTAPQGAHSITASEEASVGIPWTGAPGITETVQQIMERQSRTAALPEGQILGIGPEHDMRGLQRKWNPEASDAPQWPPLDPFASISPPLVPQTVATTFLGAQVSESGFIPPDSMGGVGPTQVLVIVNGRIKVFDKAGVLGALNVSANTFFNSVRNGFLTSDPHVRYDRFSGRWFLSILNVPPGFTANRICLAVSSGSTITNTSSFTFFQFQQDLVGVTPNLDTGNFADYDTLGVDQNALYVGVNIFDQIDPFPTGTTGFVIRKSDLLAGTLTVTAFRQLVTCDPTMGVCGTGPLTPQGVDNDDGSAAEGYFIGVDGAVFSKLTVRRVLTPGGTPSISGNIIVAGTIPATTLPILQPALGSTHALDSIDDRLFAAAIHKNKTTGVSSLWTAHNIQVNSSGVASNTGGRNGSRWYEIVNMTTTPTLNQAGTLFDSAASNPLGFWVPSVAMSGQGHMALGSSRAGAANRAEIAVAGRLSSDTAGSIQPPTLAQTSTTAYNVESNTPQRWGDYSQVVVDPNDDMTMWTFQEYCNATNSWGLRVIQLLAPPPATPASTSPSSMAQGTTGSIALTGTAVSGSGFFDPGPGFANRIAAAVNGGGVSVGSIAYTDPTHITLTVFVSAGAAAGARTVTVTNPDGQAVTSASGILTITAGGPFATVTNINPNSGSMDGGTPVTIGGTNFQSGATVTIGGVPAAGVVFGTSTSLTAVTGPHAAGLVDVTVINPNNQFGTLTNGYTYAGMSFFTVTPCRILDTRDPVGLSGGPQLSPGSPRTFPVTGLCTVPSTAKAVAIMLAVVSPGDGGDIRLYPAGNSPPGTSAINFQPGAIRANNGVIPLGLSGQMSALLDMPLGSTATTHFVIDVYGYFQ